MRIKTFEASTLQEALALAKNELGEDAVVLNTKHVRANGLLGLRGASKVELMAAVDDPAPTFGIPVPGATLGSIASAPAPIVEMEPARVAVAPEPPPVPVSTLTPAPLAARAYAGFSSPSPETDSELQQLRTELKQLTSVVHGLVSSRGSVAAPERPLLVKMGVDEDLARSLMGELMSIDEPYALASALAARMQSFAAPPVLDTRQVIAVVGPTGVGKTTTLAKLAARFALEQGKRVALVTADTFRIGAVEQLRTYARIMDVPLEIALTPEEVAAGVEKHRDKDVVLIDTVGRSQRSGEHLKELKTFLDAARPTQTFLVVAASMGNEMQNEVVENFTLLSPTRLVITKLDECQHRGSLVNLPLRTGLGISCITAGQNVPQDIEFADAGSIARLVAGVA